MELFVIVVSFYNVRNKIHFYESVVSIIGNEDDDTGVLDYRFLVQHQNKRICLIMLYTLLLMKCWKVIIALSLPMVRRVRGRRILWREELEKRLLALPFTALCSVCNTVSL